MKPIQLILLLLLASISRLGAEVVCTESENQIVITRNGKHVLSYQKTIQIPDGVPAKYGRNGFIHPISTPSGRVITDGYPMPHHGHQHGLFFAWRKGSYKGEPVNFWEHGRDTVRHSKVLKIINRKQRAGFRAELEHISGELVILREIWSVAVDDETGHIDLASEQRNITDSPLILDKYHYGAMAIRGSRQWFSDAHTSAGKGATKDEFVSPATMLTNEGLNAIEGNHSRPTWVSMTGPIDGAPVSITLIQHPTNFRYPQHARLHPKMPYFCFIPTVEQSFQIDAGDVWRSKYLIIAEDGKPTPAKLNRVQKGFGELK